MAVMFQRVARLVVCGASFALSYLPCFGARSPYLLACSTIAGLSHKKPLFRFFSLYCVKVIDPLRVVPLLARCFGVECSSVIPQSFMVLCLNCFPDVVLPVPVIGRDQ
jgi:hypothetical protein|tara:strand:- start:4165 stop:4488 length:324 start_codon:yes stop_codon:yes gene_type:complete